MPGSKLLTLINEFEKAYEPLLAKLKGLSKAQIDFVPADPADAWSINDHLVHLLDADCNLVFRVRGSVAEPGKTSPVWDQEAWHTQNKYSASDGLAALAIAVSLRGFIAASLRCQDDAVLEAAWINHPERGRMSLEALLAMYTRHAATHLAYVERNLAAFGK